MKVETRKVTVEQNVYIAEDGKEFDDKDECENYEFRLIEKSLKFYTRKFEECDLESCTYVYLRTDDEVLKLIRLCDLDGITTECLDSVGTYVYDNHIDRWINMSAAIARIEALQ